MLRTTPLLRGLRRADPGCHITWLTEPSAVPMLQGITEIELYGRGEKIISAFDCSPCYLSTCPREVTCMQVIPAGRVLETALRVPGRPVGIPTSDLPDRTSP